MLITRTFFVFLTALLLISAKAGADERDSAIIFATADGLFSRSIGRANEKLADTGHFEKGNIDGGRVYVVLGLDEKRRSSTLMVLNCDATGSVRSRHTIADQKIADITAIEYIESLPDGRIFIECHVNPRLCVGIALDLTKGQPLFLRGDGFTWPDSGRHIAYFVEILNDEAAGKPGVFEIWIDGAKVREVPADEFVGLSWNSRGTRLTANLSGPGKTDRQIVMSVSGDASVATSN